MRTTLAVHNQNYHPSPKYYANRDNLGYRLKRPGKSLRVGVAVDDCGCGVALVSSMFIFKSWSTNSSGPYVKSAKDGASLLRLLVLEMKERVNW